MATYGISTYGTSTGLTADEIKNLALFELGFPDEIDFTDLDHPVVEKVDRVYSTVLLDTLSNYPWRFIMKRQSLTSRSDANDNYKFKYNYTLPATMLSIKNPFYDNNYSSVIKEYESSSTYINTDATTCFLAYTSVVDETDFPKYFVNFFKYRLARALCFNLTGDRELLQDLVELEKVFLRSAKNTDAKQNPAKRVKSSPFTHIRG